MVTGTRVAPHRSEAGQLTTFMALVMGIFLIGFVGFATDYTSFWFQRQAAQSAADAMCQAAAVDMYLIGGNFANSANFTPGSSSVSCTSATPYPAPCSIAKYNGFDGTASGTTVQMSFAKTFSGYNGSPALTYPFVTVNVTKQANAYFSTLLTRQSAVTVHTTASCGILGTLGPGQVVVLKPYPQKTDVTLESGATMKVAGGANVGLQVNADAVSGQSSKAISFGSGSVADFSQGGPNNTGSDVALAGIENDPGPTTYNRGTSGVWVSPDLPVLDPYQGITVPSQPGAAAAPATGVKNDGCPLTSSPYCTEYSPGYYSSGITVGTTANTVAIFKPGVYWLDGNFTVSNGSIVRNAIVAGGHDTDGVFFYFDKGYPSIAASNNSLNSMASTTLTCNGQAPPSFGTFTIPSSLTGNVLISQCTTDGTYVSGSSGNTSGTIRGLLFMINPANSNTLTPSLAGSSSTVSAYVGNQYLHTCNSTAGSGCDLYDVNYTVTGAAGDGVIIWGNVVTDTLTIGGAYETPFLLSGTGTSPANKIAMIQ